MTDSNNNNENVARIPLGNGKYTVIEHRHLYLINDCKWCFSNGYARNTQKKGLMHRFLYECIKGTIPKGMQIDHINGDKLDNRLFNLRLVTNSQNQMNSRKRKKAMSKYKGVGWDKGNNKWQAKIEKNGKNTYLGLFTSEDAAARTYDIAAIKLFHDYARTNFPKEDYSKEEIEAFVFPISRKAKAPQ